MAKFQGKHLKLKDNQRTYFGTSDDSSIWFDGSQLRISTAVSGVDPVQGYHLTTKQYVDNVLGGVDHSVYVLTDGTRPFTSTVSGVTPTDPNHLATKGYIDSEISTISSTIITDHGLLTGLNDDDHTQYILVDGTRAFTGTVSGVSPTSDNHLATKGYVDSVATGLSVHEPVRLASTGEFVAVYNNGSSGVGATLTNNGTKTALVVDGVPVAINDRILVKDQTNSAHNGIYIVTVVGDGSTNWELTRAGDFDNSPTNEIHDGDFFFIQEGNTNAHKGYVQTEPDPITLGTGNIKFLQFSEAGQVVDGAALSFSGNTLNVNVDNTTISISGDQLSVVASGIDHNALKNTHNLTTDINHGSISGLGNDDHTQYILVDGTRAFSATVSGITPTDDAHLATKGYVDNLTTNRTQNGRVALALNDSTKAITFNTAYADTNYSVNVIITNTTDPEPSLYVAMVSAKATTGFTVLLSGDIDSANYVLEWIAVHD